MLPDQVESLERAGPLSTLDRFTQQKIFLHALADRRQRIRVKAEGLDGVMPELDPRNPWQHLAIGGDRHQIVGEKPPTLTHERIGQSGFAGTGVAQAHDGLTITLEGVSVQHKNPSLDEEGSHRRTQKECA